MHNTTHMEHTEHSQPVELRQDTQATPHDRLRQAIEQLATPLHEADPSWCVFGSYALVLNGVPGIKAHDVDIMLSASGLRHLLGRMPQMTLVHDDRPDSLFRSLHARIVLDGIEVDLSGDLEIKQAGQWVSVQVRRALHDGLVRYASPQDCARLLLLFGREKDGTRLQALGEWAAQQNITLVP